MDYQYREIEQRWQQFWAKNQTYKVNNQSAKPKFYVLDMFPYPSGAGLHVGHPLGYIASDIYSRYKRLKGFNVLHPMGYDSFGLPAEQYAIQTGQHPAITTEANINRYREQLDNLGFSYDWSREVRTSEPEYYRWTQWIFMKLFDAWYNENTDRAETIQSLAEHFSQSGSTGIKATADEDVLSFTAAEWNTFSEEEQQKELLKYRLAYLKESTVNWCPALGTVLANDEVKDGFSERGGHPVVQKKMMQWSMRITAYADRLLQGLDHIDWPEPLKEMQRNWIGKSVGALVKFEVESGERFETSQSTTHNLQTAIEVFTTRVDTIFGASFLVLAPEHELVAQLTTPEQQKEISDYILQTQKKSELDRMADTKTVSGAFTGAYAKHPFTGQAIPVWIADYVLAGYGTGAVMAVPSGDQRDWLFAKHFNLPIPAISDVQQNLEEQADPSKEGRYINSDFINGLTYAEAVPVLITKLEEKKLGKGKVNFRLRDAIFGRQRYWGEPVPVYFKNGLPYLIEESELPLVLPEVDKYLPTESGEPPLGRAKDWKYRPAPPQPSPEGREFGYRETADAAYYESLKEYSRHNRKNPTIAENVLWQLLRDNQIGYKFRRQHAVGQFIADFICLQKGIIIEVDGGYHADNQEADQLRTDILKNEGFEVIRLTNEEVLTDPDGALRIIKQKLDNLPNTKVLPTGEDLGGAYDYELSTMPGWAGSSWYWYRYMASPEERKQLNFAPQAAIDYWQDVDLYIGGSEHATGHLLYSRFWNKFLKDLGYVSAEEPFKKLINQGMIQGRSNFVYRMIDEEGRGTNTFVSLGLKDQYKTVAVHVDVNIVEQDILDLEKFKTFRSDFADAQFILENGKYHCGHEVEKMSKSKFNVVNPDVMVERYGADTLRLYEMFLGPLEQSKPWNTNGIEGVFKFLRKYWRLFHDEQMNFTVSDANPAKAELKALHKIIKKVEEDVDRFSFNTSVSSFMICVNELTDLKCNNRQVLQDLTIVLSAYAPHIAEEIWSLLGNEPGSISYAGYPKFNPEYLVEDEFAYPVSINGKLKMNLNLPLSLEIPEIEKAVLANADVQRYLDGQTPKKVIVVKGRIVNLVL